MSDNKKKNVGITKAQLEMLERTASEMRGRNLENTDEFAKLKKAIDASAEAYNAVVGSDEKITPKYGENGTANRVQYDEKGNRIELKEGEAPKELEKKSSKVKSVKVKKNKTSNINGIITDQNFGDNIRINLETYMNENEDDVSYDVIPLPSKGQCYPKDHPLRKSGGMVGITYLTAADEDKIVQPNLYNKGFLFNILVKRKLRDKSINPYELVSADRDAIILWLRATSYGNEYPMTVMDYESNKTFDTQYDLSTLKFNNFTLQGDDDGLFEFELPLSKDIVKFKFFTVEDDMEYARYLDAVNHQMQLARLKSIASDIKFSMENYDFSKELQEQLKTSYDSIVDTAKTMQEDDENIYDMEGITFTKKMSMHIQKYIKIDKKTGDKTIITDKEEIEKLVKKMIARDSLKLRQFIAENTPEVDFNIKIERPKDLGGGFIDTRFPFDNYIFFNISQ